MGDEETIRALSARVAELEASLEAAQQRARRLEDMIDSAPALMWEAEGQPGQPGYRMVYVSRQIERILGYTREEWTANPMLWAEIIHPDDRDLLRHRMRQLAQEGGRAPEHRFLTKDGREVWVEPQLQPVRDAAGAPIGRRVFALDVTERQQAQKELDNLVQRLDGLISSFPGAVWEAAGGTPRQIVNLKYVSPYVTTFSGYFPEDFVDHPEIWQTIIPPDDLARITEEIEVVCESGGGTLNYRWITKDGRVIWVDSSIRILRDEEGAPVGACGVTMDVTERKLLAETEARFKDEVIKAQAATLAELGTPIIPISSEILVMPLVGAIDNQRSARVIETLLHGIVRSRARVAILDITGVTTVDTHTADALIRAARAVRLLGAEVLLTGMRPEIAHTLITLDVDLTGIITRGTLEAGIRYASHGARGRVNPRS